MRITGYRTLRTVHDWGRPVGDVNGYIASGVTDVPLVILETDEGIEGALSHADASAAAEAAADRALLLDEQGADANASEQRVDLIRKHLTER